MPGHREFFKDSDIQDIHALSKRGSLLGLHDISKKNLLPGSQAISKKTLLPMGHPNLPIEKHAFTKRV
jgi:hypothetical protein